MTTPLPPQGAPASPPRRSRRALILSDVHFWVPVAVLIAGLLVLQWIR